ncbi:MAG: hypothetical protein IPK60_00465 [Sandaracinaceae bacterium]|nr:hypothetical protein [Sandaracinaceae bacterium]
MKQRLRSLFEILTVGFPFCAFKVLTGHFLLDVPGFAIAGAFLLALGIVDIGINFTNFVGVALGRETRLLGICAIHQAVLAFRPRRAAWSEVASSADALLSFGIVAYMLLSRSLSHLSELQLYVWTLSTVLNVLGAGLGRVVQSVRELHAGKTA